MPCVWGLVGCLLVEREGDGEEMVGYILEDFLESRWWLARAIGSVCAFVLCLLGLEVQEDFVVGEEG